MDQEIFNATVAAVESSASYLNLYNESQWAKLAMGNTAWHVKTNIENLIQNSSTHNTQPVKFALFSGHDTTVQPFLAAIAQEAWDKHWPGYAAMVSLEIYSGSAQSSSDYLFRMVYNSEPLVIPGCSDSLCDLTVLLNAMSFAEQDMPCATTPDTASTDSSCGDDDSGMSTTDWSIIAILSGLLGGLIGAGLVVFLNKQFFEGELKKPLLEDSLSHQI